MLRYSLIDTWGYATGRYEEGGGRVFEKQN